MLDATSFRRWQPGPRRWKISGVTVMLWGTSPLTTDDLANSVSPAWMVYVTREPALTTRGEQTEGTRELNLDVPDLREGQDGLWVNCGPHREPTCIHADLNLKWFSKQDAAARSANRQFAGVAGDGAELSGRFLNDNDSPG